MTAADEGARPYALTKLKPYAELIAGRADQQCVCFVESTWRNWLNDAGWGGEEIEDLFAAIGSDGTITRRVIRGLPCPTNGPEACQQLLAATLIWGRGKANGRMRHHMTGVLRRERDGTGKYDQVLERTAKLALEGRVAEAYAACVLPGLGQAFFTKWLWAAGCHTKTGPQCLVLDSRVWRTLNGELGWISWEVAGTKKWPARYQAYVDQCHDWAIALNTASSKNVSAEDVEWALFEANGGLARLRPKPAE